MSDDATAERVIYEALGVPAVLTDENVRRRAAAVRLARTAGVEPPQLKMDAEDRQEALIRIAERVVPGVVAVLASGEIDDAIAAGSLSEEQRRPLIHKITEGVLDRKPPFHTEADRMFAETAEDLARFALDWLVEFFDLHPEVGARR